MDPWEFADPVDITSKIPENFEEQVASKKWTERKEIIEVVLKLATDNIRLDPKANYNVIIDNLSKVLAKDANINVAVVAAKCLTQLANGLRKKFAPYVSSIAPIIFEKFKEKKVVLRDPLIEAIDVIIATSTLEVVCDEILAALGKNNPSIRHQVLMFIYRVFKTYDAKTAPKKAVKIVTPVIAKCTGDSDAEVREAACSALAAISKAVSMPVVKTMIGDVAGDKTKMTQIEKIYNELMEESPIEAGYVAEEPGPPPQTVPASRKSVAPVAAAKPNRRVSVAPSSTPLPSEDFSVLATPSSSAPAVIESDPWEFLDPVDITSKIPENFEEQVASKKWIERKEILEVVLKLTTDNIKLDPKANYNVIIENLSNVLAKDANINVAAVAAKCLTQFANGLRKKFAPYVSNIAPIIFEKFKEKKIVLRDPLIEAIDAIITTTSLDVVCDEILAALGKTNPSIRHQVLMFIYRSFKKFNARTVPKKAVKALTPMIVKCTGDSDAEVREAACSALASIMRAVSMPVMKTMIGDIAGDKTKMAQIEKIYNELMEEPPIEDGPVFEEPETPPRTVLASRKSVASASRKSVAPAAAANSNRRASVAPSSTPKPAASSRTSLPPVAPKPSVEPPAPIMLTGPPKTHFTLSASHYEPLPTFSSSAFPSIDFGLRSLKIDDSCV